MAGSIWVESDGVPGRGSTFHLTFVCPTWTTDQSAGSMRGWPTDDCLSSTTARLLDGHWRASARSWGMSVVTVEGADAALAHLATAPADIVAVDVLMPGVDGLALAARIRAERPDVPVVAISSLPRRELMTRLGWAPLDPTLVVSKPVRRQSLRAALTTALAGGVTPEADPRSPAADVTLGGSHPMRILLAEDNAVNQRVALRLLERLGYRADVVENGQQAIEALERRRYDLLLTDVEMPVMDGIEATRAIVARWSPAERPRIVAMTAAAMQGDRERCLDAGADDYVTKPIRPATSRGHAAQHRGLRDRARQRPDVPTVRTPPEAADTESVDHEVLRGFSEAMAAGDRGFISEIIDDFLVAAPQLLMTSIAPTQPAPRRISDGLPTR